MGPDGPNHVACSYASVVEPQLDFGLSDEQSGFFQPDNNFPATHDLRAATATTSPAIAAPCSTASMRTRPEATSCPSCSIDTSHTCVRLPLTSARATPRKVPLRTARKNEVWLSSPTV